MIRSVDPDARPLDLEILRAFLRCEPEEFLQIGRLGVAQPQDRTLELGDALQSPLLFFPRDPLLDTSRNTSTTPTVCPVASRMGAAVSAIKRSVPSRAIRAISLVCSPPVRWRGRCLPRLPPARASLHGRCGRPPRSAGPPPPEASSLWGFPRWDSCAQSVPPRPSPEPLLRSVECDGETLLAFTQGLFSGSPVPSHPSPPQRSIGLPEREWHSMTAASKSHPCSDSDSRNASLVFLRSVFFHFRGSGGLVVGVYEFRERSRNQLSCGITQNFPECRLIRRNVPEIRDTKHVDRECEKLVQLARRSRSPRPRLNSVGCGRLQGIEHLIERGRHGAKFIATVEEIREVTLASAKRAPSMPSVFPVAETIIRASEETGGYRGKDGNSNTAKQGRNGRR